LLVLPNRNAIIFVTFFLFFSIELELAEKVISRHCAPLSKPKTQLDSLWFALLIVPLVELECSYRSKLHPSTYKDCASQNIKMAKASKKGSAVAAQQEAENLKKKKMAQKKAASDSEVI
jgi:hypothetical protein